MLNGGQAVDRSLPYSHFLPPAVASAAGGVAQFLDRFGDGIAMAHSTRERCRTPDRADCTFLLP